jgi:predicted RNA-binding protein
MKIKFTTDFARNWKAGEIVEAKILSNGDTLVDDVTYIDTTLLMEHCVIVESEGEE